MPQGRPERNPRAARELPLMGSRPARKCRENGTQAPARRQRRPSVRGNRPPRARAPGARPSWESCAAENLAGSSPTSEEKGGDTELELGRYLHMELVLQILPHCPLPEGFCGADSWSFVPPARGWDNRVRVGRGQRPGSRRRGRTWRRKGRRGEWARLTTHVLDTMAGAPAAGSRHRALGDPGAGRGPRGGSRRAVTNSDGRTDDPLVEGEAFAAGRYELRFRAGEYLRARHRIEGGPPLFLDEVPVRFGIADPTQHYHVPLLLSAYGYSTYRGS